MSSSHGIGSDDVAAAAAGGTGGGRRETAPNIFQRLQLGKPKHSRKGSSGGSGGGRATRSSSASASSPSSSSDPASAAARSGSSSSLGAEKPSRRGPWVGIGSDDKHALSSSAASAAAVAAPPPPVMTTTSSFVSTASSTASGLTVGGSVALPGRLKMQTRGGSLPSAAAASSSSSSSTSGATPTLRHSGSSSLGGAGDGDPVPARPRSQHQALPGGTVSRLLQHTQSLSSSSSVPSPRGDVPAPPPHQPPAAPVALVAPSPMADGAGGGSSSGGSAAAVEGGAGSDGGSKVLGSLEGTILNIDLTSDDEGESRDEAAAAAATTARRRQEKERKEKEKEKEKEPGRRRRGIGELAQAAIVGGLSQVMAMPKSPPKASSSGSSSSHQRQQQAQQQQQQQQKSYTERKFEELMAADVVDLARLREQSWGGIPDKHRGTIWRLLLGYLPANRDRRETTLSRKRREYAEILPTYFNIPPEDRTLQEQEILRQILVDLPRTQPDMPLFHQEEIQRCMERVLYLWAIRHPASGYVQGMNDLITPFILVFLAERLLHPPPPPPPPPAPAAAPAGEPEADEGEHAATASSGGFFGRSGGGGGGGGSGSSSGGGTTRGVGLGSTAAAEAQALDASKIPPEVLEQVEADVYWCITKLLDNIQDHYTFSQPGLQRMIFRLGALIERHDPALHRHLEEEGLQYVQFAFRWMNCLLMRELSLDAIIRIWDTELAEENGGFEAFHVYLCAAFLLRFADRLRTLPFQDLVLFLQDLPTHDWTLHEIEPLLAQAHVLRSLYPDFAANSTARQIGRVPR